MGYMFIVCVAVMLGVLLSALIAERISSILNNSVWFMPIFVIAYFVTVIGVGFILWH